MIAPPLLQKMIEDKIAENIHELIIEASKDRLGAVPRDVTKLLRKIVDEKKLRQVNRIANKCSDLEAFRESLLS